MTRIILLLSLVILAGSCSNNDTIPDGVLKPEKMQAVLWDVIKAEAFTTDYIKKDSSKNTNAENLKLQQQVFAIHKVSKADFYKSYDYYQDNAVQFKKIVDSMIAQAERNRGTNIKTFNTKPLQVQ